MVMTMTMTTTLIVHRSHLNVLASLWNHIEADVLDVQARRHGVNRHRHYGREHGNEAAERKLVPGFIIQASQLEHVERIRQNVHKSGSEDDAGGERLNDVEDVAVRVQNGDRTSNEREANPYHTRQQYGDNGYGF